MTEQVIKSVFSLLPFLWDKNEVESPDKEKNQMDFGDLQAIHFRTQLITIHVYNPLLLLQVIKLFTIHLRPV
jgi:hypothetical protein